MISDEYVQADIISKLKSTPAIIALFSGTNQIKEFEWQGDEFIYPAVRLDLESNDYEFENVERCALQKAEFSIYIFSEKRSSKECSQIKGIIATALIGLGFTGSYAKYTEIHLPSGGNIPAIRQDERTWRSQIKLWTFVQNR